MPDACERARRLIERDGVEGIAADEREWRDGHIAACASCAAYEALQAEAIRTVRFEKVEVPPDLALRTRFRVSLRGQELRRRQSAWALWVSLVLSWVVGVASAPLVWRAADWVARSAGAPQVMTWVAVGMWWAAPAAIAAGVWMFERKRVEEE